MRFVRSLYLTETEARYKELRDKGVFSVDNIFGKVTDWMNRIGENFFNKEYTKWNDSPCNRTLQLRSGWKLSSFSSYSEYSSTPAYSGSVTYNAGDKCKSSFMIFEATETVQGVSPVIKEGHYDNIYRLQNWISERLRLEDIYLNY